MGIRSVRMLTAGVTYRLPLLKSTDTPRNSRVADGDDDVVGREVKR